MRLEITQGFGVVMGATVQAEQTEFVNLAKLPIPPLWEIRYTTPYNFTGKPLYSFPAAFLHPKAAAALKKIQAELAEQGMGLKIWDAYRPLSVQQKMWNLIHDEPYISDPSKNSGRHARGMTVDVTLVDKTGREMEMPADFDNFTEAAYCNAPASEASTRNRALLHAVMTKHGFEIFPYEWWHFDLKGWPDSPPLNVGFEPLR